MVHIILERLSQRLTVLPRVAMSIRKRLAADVLWRVDREFASTDRFPEAGLSDLLPEGVESVMAGFAEVALQIGERRM